MQFSDAVAQRLSIPATDHAQRFLIVDQAGLPGVIVPSLLRWPAESTDLLTLRPTDWRTGASPALIPAPNVALTSPQLSALDRCLRCWQFCSSLTYLETSELEPTFTVWLRARLQARLADGSDVVLRWFDGRTAAALLTVLTSSQLSELWSGLSMALAQTRDGGALNLLQELAEAGNHASDSLPLRLSEAQELALLDSCEADVLVDQLLRLELPQFLEWTPPEQHAWVVRQLARCQSELLTQLPEQIAHCLRALELEEASLP